MELKRCRHLPEEEGKGGGGVGKKKWLIDSNTADEQRDLEELRAGGDTTETGLTPGAESSLPSAPPGQCECESKSVAPGTATGVLAGPPPVPEDVQLLGAYSLFLLGLYLVGLQLIGVTGEPLDQVP
ncbi:hypothetical protein EYF80_027121 [Liparis tanakae]|uniref:Uncharacterized protein n=1 Tax=Liparis tanakae TaxID=230148 RepID=A0A4Z2HAX6_9TELE|nr:hypothetical protein EYF80_027121 [Liparis tanakae]